MNGLRFMLPLLGAGGGTAVTLLEQGQHSLGALVGAMLVMLMQQRKELKEVKDRLTACQTMHRCLNGEK